MLRIDDDQRVRTIAFDRADALNALDEALYDRTTEALMDAAADPTVAVVVLTGTGRAFCAGTDVVELASRTTDPDGFTPGVHGFNGLVDQLAEFPKPLICAVNGLALGAGVTLLGFADLVFMSAAARVRCPFTDLGVAPEAASSVLFPQLLGHQEATWFLMSSEWFDAEECLRMGLAWRLSPPDGLMNDALEVARVLAAKPIASLVETKRTIVAARRDAIASARSRENRAFSRLMGAPANIEALAALGARRDPDFVTVDVEHPVDIAHHLED